MRSPAPLLGADIRIRNPAHRLAKCCAKFTVVLQPCFAQMHVRRHLSVLEQLEKMYFLPKVTCAT
jgi:hypothetical protein